MTIRALTLVAVTAASTLIGGWSRSLDPDACALISLNDALAIIGPPLGLNHTTSTTTFSNCIYNRPNKDPLAIPESVEIHYWLLADVPTAQAKFQRVVHPTATTGPGTTMTSVPGLGDEADIKRTPGLKLNSIEFRRGAAIVTIGVSPIVSDSLLKAAAVKALGRL
jgi:hypothetical protein